MIKDIFFNIKKNISKEKRIISEMDSLLEKFGKIKNESEKRMINSQITSLKNSLKEINNEMPVLLGNLSLKKTEKKLIPEKSESEKIQKRVLKDKNFFLNFLNSLKNKILRNKEEKYTRIEEDTVKRFGKKKKKKIKKKEKKPSKYVNLSTRIFADFSRDLIKKGYFKKIRKDLVRANLQLVDTSYISIIFFTTLISLIAGFLIFVFFLFFNIGVGYPMITLVKESLIMRFFKIFWIIPLVPLSVFIFIYLYPSLERMSLTDKINNELPFATIHMSAVSSSMVNPSKIFEIIVATGEYPHLEKEFKKLLNEINVYGYDLVSALKDTSYNTPSLKLKELFNGLAITINSGGDLQEFFDKRAETLLFDYKIEREKYTKTAETFMDIYISVVIAAPMILMLLIVMMKISGLGISLSTNMITLVVVMSVSMINIFFLTFLHLKQTSK
jgi:Flp pilus assembly protein TadB